MKDYAQILREKRDEKLLQVFILLEQNTFEASKEATNLYMQLSGIDKPAIAFSEAKRK